MAKILLIGATGFLGKHLVPKLGNFEVTYLVRPTGNIKHLKGKKITFGDITDIKSLLHASKNKDIIINLATPTTQKDDINRKIIVGGTKNLIEVAKKNNIRKLITLSSVAGYRKSLDSYGKAKKQADDLLLGSKLDIIILKPTMIFGHGGYLFEKIKTAVTKIPLFVFMVGKGQYKIQPIYVEDIVQAIINSISKPVNGVEIFDLGGPYPINCEEFFKKILNTLHKKKLFIHVPINFVIFMVKFLNFFFKNIAFNPQTIKRMVEEVKLDVEKSKKELNLKITDYDKALSLIFPKL